MNFSKTDINTVSLESNGNLYFEFPAFSNSNMVDT
jgi:hypothetical protein